MYVHTYVSMMCRDPPALGLGKDTIKFAKMILPTFLRKYIITCKAKGVNWSGRASEEDEICQYIRHFASTVQDQKYEIDWMTCSDISGVSFS